MVGQIKYCGLKLSVLMEVNSKQSSSLSFYNLNKKRGCFKSQTTSCFFSDNFWLSFTLMKILLCPLSLKSPH
jgi:hypothetical protein